MEAWETRKHFESGAKCLIAMVFILLVYYSDVRVYAFVILRSQVALTSLAHSCKCEAI